MRRGDRKWLRLGCSARWRRQNATGRIYSGLGECKSAVVGLFTCRMRVCRLAGVSPGVSVHRDVRAAWCSLLDTALRHSVQCGFCIAERPRCHRDLTYAPTRPYATGADREGAPLTAGASREVAGPAMLTEARRSADLLPPGELLAAEAAAAC